MNTNLPSYRYGPAFFSGEVITPLDYNFETHIDDFIKKSGKNLSENGQLCDANFANVSNKLVPGKKYRTEIVPIIEYIGHCQQCLNDLLTLRGIKLFGTQGLVLFKQQHPHRIPKGNVLSFDRRKNLYLPGIDREVVPYMRFASDGITGFSYIHFWSSLSSQGQYVLVFFEDD